MKYFVDKTDGRIFAYETDGSQDGFINPTLELITEEDVAALQSANEDPKEKIIREITELEQQVTARRVREALLSGDTGFIKNVNDEIERLRIKL